MVKQMKIGSGYWQLAVSSNPVAIESWGWAGCHQQFRYCQLSVTNEIAANSQ